MIKSNWEITKERSKYHFDNTIFDSRWDAVHSVGKLPVTWQSELNTMIESSKPVSWRTRGRDNDPLTRKSEEYDQEEYDLEKIGMPKDYIVTNLNYTLTPGLEKVANLFCLEKCMSRVHVQRPGQVWNLHLDKLEKWMPNDPSKVVRYFIQLTDWEQGHFWNFGNYMWSGWKAGDVVTFDWLNVPHSTANAGHSPRVTLQITGIKTEQTDKFLEELKLTSF